MKKWNRPNMTILTSEQLKSSIRTFANSDCIYFFVR